MGYEQTLRRAVRCGPAQRNIKKENPHEIPQANAVRGHLRRYAGSDNRLFRLTDGRQAHHSHFSCTVRNPPRTPWPAQVQRICGSQSGQ